MDNSTLQRISDAIQQSKSVAVAVGKNPTIDEMAAMLSLYLSLQAMGKQVSPISATDPIVELSNLVGIDKVKTRYEGDGADLIVSFPYREGEIEKVSYTIENTYLNIVVKAGEQGLNFSEQDVKYTRGGSGGQLDLLIVLGAPQLADIHVSFGPDTLKDVTIINIDNKQENQGFGDIVFVSPRFSSVSEQVTQLLSDLKSPIDVDIAQNLLDGIMYGTENFQSPRTSYLAFEMSGILMRQGAVRSGTQPLATTPTPAQTFAPAPMSEPRRPQQQLQNRDNNRRQQFDNRRQPQQQSQPQPHSMPRPQPRVQPQPQQHQQQQSQPQSPLPQQQPADSFADVNPPTDWLTPKVYKGSSNV